MKELSNVFQTHTRKIDYLWHWMVMCVAFFYRSAYVIELSKAGYYMNEHLLQIFLSA